MKRFKTRINKRQKILNMKMKKIKIRINKRPKILKNKMKTEIKFDLSSQKYYRNIYTFNKYIFRYIYIYIYNNNKEE